MQDTDKQVKWDLVCRPWNDLCGRKQKLNVAAVVFQMSRYVFRMLELLLRQLILSPHPETHIPYWLVRKQHLTGHHRHLVQIEKTDMSPWVIVLE